MATITDTVISIDSGIRYFCLDFELLHYEFIALLDKSGEEYNAQYLWS
jgi:hypothetical protein